MSEPTVNVPGVAATIKELQPGRIYHVVLELPAGFESRACAARSSALHSHTTKPFNMPSATLKRTPKPTSPTSSRTERTGKLIGPPMTACEFDRIAREHGARVATPEEARSSREAQIRAGLDV